MSARAWLRLALACSLIPCVLGVGVFLAWLPGRAEAWGILGLLTIVGGTALFPVGIFAVMRYLARAKREPASGRAALIATALLLLNFPLAGVLWMGADRLRAEVVVTVRNQSARPLLSAQLWMYEPAARTGLVPPGGEAVMRFKPEGSGPLSYRLLFGGVPVLGPEMGRVDVKTGGRWALTIAPDGTVRVEDLRQLLIK